MLDRCAGTLGMLFEFAPTREVAEGVRAGVVTLREPLRTSA